MKITDIQTFPVCVPVHRDRARMKGGGDEDALGAGLLQRAKIIGTRTWGKGSVQEIFSLKRKIVQETDGN